MELEDRGGSAELGLHVVRCLHFGTNGVLVGCFIAKKQAEFVK